MNNVYIDYDLLLSSSGNIETTASNIKNEKNDLYDIKESIKALGKEHDNCLYSISNKPEELLETTVNNILNLSSIMMTTVDIFTKAELAVVDNLHIQSKGIEEAIKFYHNKTYNNKLQGYDYDYYQKLFDDSLSIAKGTRAKSTMAAIFLSTTFPHMNYFWGGGHDKISEGLDPTWGNPKLVTAEGSDTTGTKQPNSLDCSGYVSWALKNGGYDISKPMVTGELEQLGEKVPITSSQNENIQAGDLAYMEGHVGMIIRKEGNEITISHCSGSGNGMNITKIDIKTGLVTEDWSNGVTTNRKGKKYFTDIIKIDYKD